VADASAPLFEFDLRYVDRHRDPDVVTRWDRAKTATVRATTRADAFQVLWQMLGDAPRGRTWTATIDTARQLVPEVERTVVTSFQVDRASVLRDAADTVLREVARVWPGHRWPLAREVAEYAAEVLRAEAREASS